MTGISKPCSPLGSLLTAVSHSGVVNFEVKYSGDMTAMVRSDSIVAWLILPITLLPAVRKSHF